VKRSRRERRSIYSKTFGNKSSRHSLLLPIRPAVTMEPRNRAMLNRDLQPAHSIFCASPPRGPGRKMKPLQSGQRPSASAPKPSASIVSELFVITLPSPTRYPLADLPSFAIPFGLKKAFHIFAESFDHIGRQRLLAHVPTTFVVHQTARACLHRRITAEKRHLHLDDRHSKFSAIVLSMQRRLHVSNTGHKQSLKGNDQ